MVDLKSSPKKLARRFSKSKRRSSAESCSSTDLDLSDEVLKSSAHTDKQVVKLTESFHSMRSEFEEFKRTSSMERDALVKQLNIMKELKDEEDALTRKEATNNSSSETKKEDEKEEEKKGPDIIKSALAAFSDQFDDEGFLKCCLPPGN